MQTSRRSMMFLLALGLAITAISAVAQNEIAPEAGPTALRLVTVPPCRVVDTRNPNGTFGGPPIQGGTFRNFPIAQGRCGIPLGAVAFSLNVTVVPFGPLNYLTVWPTGQPQPLAATLDSLDGRIKANAVIVASGTGGGAVSIFATDTTNVAVDIDGYFVASGSLAFYALTPCRLADTRPQYGGGGPIPGGTVNNFHMIGVPGCTVPPSAKAYSLNIAAVPPGRLDYLTVWPAGSQRPVVSTLNDQTGTVVANAAIVGAGVGGDISVYPTQATNLVIDVNGYFAPVGAPNALALYPLAAPCRVLDTRLAGGAFSGQLVVDVVDSMCGLPPTAQAYGLNATVVPVGFLGYLTLWADGGTQPVVSTLNALDGFITNNMAIVPTTNGSIDAFASGTTQLILDVSNYFAP